MEQLALPLLAWIGVLALVLVLRHRLAKVVAILTWPLFLLLAAIALSAVGLPRVYEGIAQWTVERSGLAAQVRQIDDQLVLNQIADASSALLERAGDLFGMSRTERKQPTFAQTRLVEQAVLPGLVSTVSLILRWSTLLVTAAAMLSLVSLNVALSTDADRRQLVKRLADLEARTSES